MHIGHNVNHFNVYHLHL